jgi:hypothetical protein
MTLTLAGIKTLFNPLFENAHDSIRCNFDPFSNVIDSSDLQLEKHSMPITLTLAGIKRLFSPVHENAPRPMCGHCESFSNLIDSSD